MGKFSLLSMNCFGVPGLNTGPRLQRLSQELNNVGYSVVCLQEVQSHRNLKLLIEGCKRCYPAQAYQHFVHAPKGGLLTLSNDVIDKSEFKLFEQRGLWYTPALADWILHKGVLVAHLKIDDLPIVVMNTHLTANYLGDWSRANWFAKQEFREVTQIAKLVNAQPQDAIVIVCGDFNFPRGSWIYEALVTTTGLVDPMNGDQRPTFRPYKGMGRQYGAPIDFTLYRAPDSLELQVENDLRFQDKVKVAGRDIYLSDHIGVELRLTWDSVKVQN